MDAHEQSNRHPWLRLLGFILPIGALAAIGWSLSSIFTEKRSDFPSAWLLAVVGLSLSLVYLILVFCRIKTRTGGRTALSAVISVFLMIGASGVVFLAFVTSAISSAFAPSLASVLQDQVEDARVPAGVFLDSGPKSGSLTGADWANPEGGKVAISVDWVKNADGVLVTASPVGSIPKGQDGTPLRQQYLDVDVLGFPLDYFTAEARQPFVSIFSDWLLMFNKMVEGSASPIIDYAKEHDGRLPSVEEAEAILGKASKSFKFDFKDDDGGDKPVKIDFVIKTYTYEEKKNGIFEIRYAWSCDYVESNSGVSSDGAPVTGVISIDFSSSGLMVMNRKNGELQHPLAEVLEAFEQRGQQAAKDKSSIANAGK
ncbi:hypothetical protein OAG62_00160 [bacterium]|nr:hypothetical protein [bacterium]